MNTLQLCQYDYIESAKFLRTNTINGTLVNVFQWQDKLGPISMNTLQLSVTADGTNLPVFMHRDVHPFGKEPGFINTTYSGFLAGPPNATAFVVPGIDKCPEGPDQICDGMLARVPLFKFRQP
jgi:hypothetical protein